MAVELGRDDWGIMGSRLGLLLEEYGLPLSYDSEYDPESLMGKYFCFDDPEDSDLPIGADILRNLACLGSYVVGPYEDYIGRDQQEQKSYVEEDDDEEFEDNIDGNWISMRRDQSDIEEDDDEELVDSIDGKGYRKMTKEEHEDYNKQINKNLGFDVVVPKDIVGCGILKPLWFIEGGPVMDTLKHCSKLAVRTYNEIHKMTFVFDKVLKANAEICCCIYYITFVAVDRGDICETFQATVYEEEPLSGFHVGFCRIKPQS